MIVSSILPKNFGSWCKQIFHQWDSTMNVTCVLAEKTKVIKKIFHFYAREHIFLGHKVIKKS